MKSGDKPLLELFERLAPEQQDRLIAFAEFLADEPAEVPDAVLAPLVIPRPDGESVTMAIRRLVRSYPMLDRRQLMVEASQFMAQHALEGRPASEVIDELETVFARHYQRLRERGDLRDEG
ncbi:MAG TPA: hypothetical protein VLC73_01515 [Burkholderiales bacterium]|nr:hypothetical protein [Burkholderiales bacterium]